MPSGSTSPVRRQLVWDGKTKRIEIESEGNDSLLGLLVLPGLQLQGALKRSNRTAVSLQLLGFMTLKPDPCSQSSCTNIEATIDPLAEVCHIPIRSTILWGF